MNGRYKVLKQLGDGAFADVFLCQDLKPNSIPRLLSDETLRHLDVMSQEAPDFEFQERDFFSEEHKEAAEYLANLKKIFPQNNIHCLSPASEENQALVAVKVCKQNKFNLRDGVLFYALREL